jgi:hypothetical protein
MEGERCIWLRADETAAIRKRMYDGDDQDPRGALNQALQELQRLKDDHQKHRQQQGIELGAQQRAELLALAQDLPGLWQAQTTSARDRKRMLVVRRCRHEERRETQGGVVSPILANIYLNKLDKFLTAMKARFDRGKHRAMNPQYGKLTMAMYRLASGSRGC